MHYFFQVTIPAGTTEGSPYQKLLPLTAGHITGVKIVIPKGHEGTAHLRLFYHEFQLYPLSRGEDYHGSGSEVQFNDRQEITAEPYELKAVGWNTDAVNDHAFLVAIEVQRLTEGGQETAATSLQDLITLVGQNVGE